MSMIYSKLGGLFFDDVKPRNWDQAEAISPRHVTPTPRFKTFVVPFDLTLSSLPTRAPASVAAVSAMAEVHLTSASTTGVLPTHGPTLISLQNDLDALKREIDGLNTTVGSLVKEIEDLRRLKVETVGDVFFPFPLSPRGTCRPRLCSRPPECLRPATHHARVVQSNDACVI